MRSAQLGLFITAGERDGELGEWKGEGTVRAGKRREEKRGRVGDTNSKRHPRSELSGTAMPTLCS